MSFAELGAKKEDIPTLLNNLGDNDHTEGHFVVLKRPDVEAIFNIAANYKD